MQVGIQVLHEVGVGWLNAVWVMVMGEVKFENGAVLEMRTSHKEGLKYRNLIPGTTQY
jgi:hypothetical protein